MSLIWPSMKTTRGFDGHLALKAPGVPSFRILTQSLLMVISERDAGQARSSRHAGRHFMCSKVVETVTRLW